MKTLWSDPIAWCEKVAKTKTRAVVWTLVQFLLCLFVMAGGIWMVSLFLGQHTLHQIPHWLLIFVIATMLVIPTAIASTFYVAMYLYAMHILLKWQRSQTTNASADKSEQP